MQQGNPLVIFELEPREEYQGHITPRPPLETAGILQGRHGYHDSLLALYIVIIQSRPGALYLEVTGLSAHRSTQRDKLVPAKNFTSFGPYLWMPNHLPREFLS